MSLHADLYKNLITLSCLLGEAKKNADFGSVAFYSYGFNEIAKHLTNVFAVSGVESVKSEFANVLLTLALQGILAEDLYKDLVVKLGHKPAGLKLSSLLPQVAAQGIISASNPLLPSTPVVQKQLSSPVNPVVVVTPVVPTPPVSGVLNQGDIVAVLPQKVTPVVNSVESDADPEAELLTQPIFPVGDFEFDFNNDASPVLEIPSEPKEEVKTESKGKTILDDPFANVSSALDDDDDFWFKD